MTNKQGDIRVGPFCRLCSFKIASGGSQLYAGRDFTTELTAKNRTSNLPLFFLRSTHPLLELICGYNLVYSINCEINDTEKRVNKNHPIKPCTIAKYRGRPLIGISPNPSVVKVLIDNISAFSILMKTS